MEILSSCVLIGFDPDAHGAGTVADEIRRTVKCTIRDVGLNEQYQAMAQGLKPAARILIPYERDYQGERELEVELDGKLKRCRVIRKTGGEYNGILLTVEPVTGNAAEVS